MKHLYILYQYLIALPLLIGITLLTAIITIVCVPFSNARWLFAIQQVWARSFYWLLFIPVTIEGRENVQRNCSYVFVSNHQSAFDIFVIYGWLPNIFKWLMKQELRKIPFVGTACKAAGHIFIDRSSAKASILSIREMEKRLTNGISTVIFPEGTRSLNGEVGRFKRGAFQVALDLALPVVPVSLSGCYEVMPKGAKYVHRHPVRMVIGKPIQLTDISSEDPQQSISVVRDAVIAGMHS